ncbi:MAG TPA: efflux RND transporter periplasmic adaptor subunit [Candidatus Polarisedimenticolia bacterium]|nr:efflux RND transporter periplasmic adaptor subunit [Candidatus Polarisedimenticolia bacterium]
MSRKAKRALIVTIGLVAIAAAGYFIFLRVGQPAEAKYRVQRVDEGDVTMTVTATGTISPVTTVLVGSQVSGIIAGLHADFNSPVKKGQVLADLDPTPFQAQVEQRRADLRQVEVQMQNASASFHRQEQLLAQNLASQADFDAAKAAYDGGRAQVDQARAALRQAQTNLTYTKIISPIDGVVVDRQYDVGQTVAASFQAPTLFTIAQDLKQMQVQADVDQSDIGRVQVGQTARFTVDAYPEENFSGKISQIRLNATVNQNIITYPVILAVPNPEEKLRPKMTADVTIEVAQVHGVLRVPNAALRFRPTDQSSESRGAAARGTASQGAANSGQGRPPRGGGLAAAAEPFGRAGAGRARGLGTQTVYVDTGGDRLKAVSIRTGISDGRFTQVLEGELKPGDSVVVGQETAKSDRNATPLPIGGGRMR